MPRIVFNEHRQVMTWAERFAQPARYTIYATSRFEVILEPLRSTAPLRYGYVRCTSHEVQVGLLTELERAGHTIIRCLEYDWATDRSIGAMTQYQEDES